MSKENKPHVEVELSNLISETEATALRSFFSNRKKAMPSAPSDGIVMCWLDKKPAVISRFRALGLTQKDSSLLITHYLNL